MKLQMTPERNEQDRIIALYSPEIKELYKIINPDE